MSSHTLKIEDNYGVYHVAGPDIGVFMAGQNGMSCGFRRHCYLQLSNTAAGGGGGGGGGPAGGGGARGAGGGGGRVCGSELGV